MIPGLIDTLLAFIDALGVIFARLLVICIVSLLGILPFAVVFYWFGTATSAYYFGLVALWGFIGATVYSWTTYIASIQGKSRSVDLVEEAPNAVQAILFICVVPAAFVQLGVAAIIPFLSRKTYLKQIKFDLLIAYVTSVMSFIAAIYCMTVSKDLAHLIFADGLPANLSDSILFTLEIITRGLFFDFLEHFRIHISHAVQGDSMLGLALTNILRLSSSALAISIVVELVKSTKSRLDAIDD